MFLVSQVSGLVENFNIGIFSDTKDVVVVAGGSGVFLTCKDFGRMFDHSFPTCAFFFFFKWRLVRAH